MKTSPDFNERFNSMPSKASENELLQLSTQQRVNNIIQPLEDDKANHIYQLNDFEPIIIDRQYLRSIGISEEIAPEALQKLIEGSHQFRRLYENRALTPALTFCYGDIDIDSTLEVHNYTGMCPTYVQEITPSVGSCSIACQYCLVTDGDHRNSTTVWRNYPDLIARILEKKKIFRPFIIFRQKLKHFRNIIFKPGLLMKYCKPLLITLRNTSAQKHEFLSQLKLAHSICNIHLMEKQY